MASRTKRGLKGSIDDVLGDLLGDDGPSPAKPQKSSPSTSASASKPRPALSSSTAKKSSLNEDFFREIAKEAAEDSDVSDADPQALLESLKDLDDMDAEIFGSRKPKSAPAKDSGMNRSIANDPKTQDKSGTKNGDFAAESEKKPQSAPAGPARPYKRFSFDDLNDPLEGLLTDEDMGLPKKSKATGAKSESAPAKAEPVSAKSNELSVVSPTRTQTRPHPGARRRDDFNFEEDGDDIIDALGFGEGPQSSQRVESSAPKPARSKMDELLGRGTSPKLLERPATGERKEFKLDPKYQKMAEKEDPLTDENFAFGSYQPTIAVSPEGRPSRRSSVRFSADGNDNMKSDGRSLASTPVTRSPAHGAKGGADWLGLKDDDDDLSSSIPLKEPPQASVTTPHSSGRPPSGPKSDNRSTPQPRANQTTPQSVASHATPPPRAGETAPVPRAGETAPVPRAGETAPVPRAGETAPVPRAGESAPVPRAGESAPVPRAGETAPVPRAGESAPVPRAGESAPVPRAGETTPVPRAGETDPVPRAGETTPVPRAGEPTPQPRATSAENPTGPPEDDEWLISALARKKAHKQEKIEEQALQSSNGVKEDSGRGTPLPRENPRKATPAIIPSINPSINAPRQRPSSETAGPSDSHRDKIQFVPAALQNDAEILQLQSRVLDLEAQVRKLQLQKEQQNMLLEALQQRHREDLELIENAQRSRLKLVEDSARQREERLQKENQELSAQYLSRCQSAEREKTEALAQYQRKLADFQQEKDGEMERIRELQRLSVQEMCRDHEEQLQRLKRLKDQEIHAVTSASSHTRSLNGVIEQMEAFSQKLSELSVRVESTQMSTSQEMEVGARQREGQLRALQERLTRQQKDMEEERSSLRMIITNMETRLNEQSRLLEQERWRVSAEQAKMDSLQRSLEEQKRIMTQQIAQQREELERAKSALLEEQQSVMTRCAEERRKLATEWAELHSQQKLSKERAESDITRSKMAESQREGALISLAKEQAEVKVQATELRNKEEQLAAAREALEKERHELQLEKDRVYATAMRVRQRAEEVESMSKLALQRQEEGENALAEARKVEGGHQERLRAIQQQLERLRQQEELLMEERKNLAHQRRQLNQLRRGLPTMPTVAQQPTAESMHLNGVPFGAPSGKLTISGIYQDKAPQSPDIYAKLALLRLSAQRDRDFLEDEQLFLEALKKSNISYSETV